MIQKSYNETPALYLIPTPIGNIKDITINAIDIMKKLDKLYCEDTRETVKLLNCYDIKTKLFINNDINEEDNISKIIRELKSGMNIGLLSDRGTPVISDPGYKIVNACIKNDINVISLPGATAFVPAITLSGLTSKPFIFFGFLSNKDSKRRKELEALKKHNMTIIFYESVHRVSKMINDIEKIFGLKNICVCRELTKKHEEIYRGRVDGFSTEMKTLKGEFVVIVEATEEETILDNNSITEKVNIYIKEGLTEKEAIKKVAKERKLIKNEVYREIHYDKKR